LPRATQKDAQRENVTSAPAASLDPAIKHQTGASIMEKNE
jgi:hypothetical protein